MRWARLAVLVGLAAVVVAPATGIARSGGDPEGTAGSLVCPYRGPFDHTACTVARDMDRAAHCANEIGHGQPGDLLEFVNETIHDLDRDVHSWKCYATNGTWVLAAWTWTGYGRPVWCWTVEGTHYCDNDDDAVVHWTAWRVRCSFPWEGCPIVEAPPWPPDPDVEVPPWPP